MDGLRRAPPRRRHGRRRAFAGVLRRVCLALAASAVVTAAPLAAQTLRGTIFDTDGHRLAGAVVRLLDEKTGVMADSARTDGDGAFVLTAADPGRYLVHVHLDGWTDVPTESVDLGAGETRQGDFRVPLIGATVVADIARRIAADPDLQRDLAEACGEPLRPWEAGLVVGEVRDRATGVVVAGARIRAESPDGGPVRATIANARGTYMLCNIPAGSGIRLRATTTDGRSDQVEIQVKPGMVSWCDLLVRARP